MRRMVDHNMMDDKIKDIFHSISVLRHQDRLHNIHDSFSSNLKMNQSLSDEKHWDLLFEAFDCFLSGAGGAMRA